MNENKWKWMKQMSHWETNKNMFVSLLVEKFGSKRNKIKKGGGAGLYWSLAKKIKWTKYRSERTQETNR